MGRSSPLFALPLLVAVCVVLPSLSAQQSNRSNGPAVLGFAELSSEFEAATRAVVEPLSRKYVEALRRLERELAIARDYEGAMAVRDERHGIEAYLVNGSASGGTKSNGGGAAAESSGAYEGSVFSAAEASALGDAELDAADGLVTLAQSGDGMRWIIRDIEPGYYQVVLIGASTGKSELELREDFFFLKSPVPSTGGDSSFKRVSLGTLKITKRAGDLTLMCASIDSPLRVRSLQLLPNKR